MLKGAKITSLTNLVYLDISLNSLQDDIPSVTELTKLKTLNIAGNKIGNGNKKLDLSNLTNLTSLNISGNNLNNINYNLGLDRLTNLIYLNISYNDINIKPSSPNITIINVNV